jgi:NAD-dependent dihydropyrimidine dehydrogenase PreA subunit
MKIHFPISRHVNTPYIRLDTSLCQACWACVTACPRHVLGKIDLHFHKHARIDQPEACKGCLLCVKACPNGAILTITKKKTKPLEKL